MSTEEMSLRGKSLLLVDVSVLKQRRFYEKLHSLGLRITALNYEVNWAAPYVDDWIIADLRNHEEVLQAIRSYLQTNPDRRFDGAMTFYEDRVPLLAAICEKFGFIGNNSLAALYTRDKYVMQERLRECGCNAIKQNKIQSIDDLEGAVKNIGFPSILKPNLGCGSEFVIRLTSEKEACDAFYYLKNSCTELCGEKYLNCNFLYQEYIEGTEFSVECYCQHGIPHVVGVHQKMPMTPPFFLETGDIAPPQVLPEELKALEEESKRALVALGVRDSLAHVEIKLRGSEAQVIEIGSRIGGDNIYMSTKHVYGFDLVMAGCCIALGIPVSEKRMDTGKCAITQYFIPEVSGTITKIYGIDMWEHHEKLIDLFLWKREGDTVSVPPEGYEVPGWMTFLSDSYASCSHIVNEMMKEVRFEISPTKKPRSILSLSGI